VREFCIALAVICGAAFGGQTPNAPNPDESFGWRVLLRAQDDAVHAPDHSLHGASAWQKELGLSDADFAALDSCFLDWESQMKHTSSQSDPFPRLNGCIRTRLTPAGARSVFHFVENKNIERARAEAARSRK
jgi:hypothetical protein